MEEIFGRREFDYQGRGVSQMNKTQFIEQLKKELSGLPQSEIDDIIRDHEEMIRDAVAAGRSEESFVATFGKPSELARNLRAEIKIEKAQDENKLPAKMKAMFGALGAVLVLAPFNLIFVLGPMMALFGLLIGGWATAVAITVVCFTVALAFFFFTVVMPTGALGWIGVGFGFLGVMFLGLAGLGFMYMISMMVAQLILRYLKWNVNFVKRQAGAV